MNHPYSIDGLKMLPTVSEQLQIIVSTSQPSFRVSIDFAASTFGHVVSQKALSAKAGDMDSKGAVV